MTGGEKVNTNEPNVAPTGFGVEMTFATKYMNTPFSLQARDSNWRDPHVASGSGLLFRSIVVEFSSATQQLLAGSWARAYTSG